jgi:hypothetical protein
MSLNDYERALIDNVARSGWQCTSVGGGEGKPPFSYTIGLWETLCTPELIVFGLDVETMFSMLSIAIDEMKKGAQLYDGARWPLLLGYDCISRRVHPSRVIVDYFNSALWYRRHRGVEGPLEAFQLFWPGVGDALFPWERGCDPLVREYQPRLDLPAEQGLA